MNFQIFPCIARNSWQNEIGRNIVAAKFIVIIKPTMILFYFNDIQIEFLKNIATHTLNYTHAQQK